MSTKSLARGSLSLLLSSLVPAAALMLPVSPAKGQSFVNPGNPPPDCTSIFPELESERVWPGYLAQWDSGEICIPFTPTDHLRPADYSGGDYYVEEFTDSRIAERWQECKQDPACAERYLEAARRSTRFVERKTGTVDSFGAIDPEGDVDLADIRRPIYFGAEQFAEPIAAADASTYIVEFTAPRDGYEREHLGMTDTIKLRGWYIQGEGVDDGNGKKVRALIVVNNGGGSEITALAHRWYELDAATGGYMPRQGDLANESSGMAPWRYHVHDLYAAGFDVLYTDRRGNGISGGVAGYNNLVEQANDIFRMMEQLNSGDGLRILTPVGEALEGAAAARVPTGGVSPYELPTVVMGYSRGNYAAQWFMHKNFVENCDYGPAGKTCKEAVGLANIRGAIVYGPNVGSLGYRYAADGEDVREAALRHEFYIAQLHDSDVLANIHKWPGLQIIRGTFDDVEGLEGSLYGYRRITGLKDISVFAGQHGLTRHPPEIMDHVGERMVAFATAAVLGHDEVDGSKDPADLKELVLSAPQLWDMGIGKTNWKPL
ncbi:hypothetical protein [Chelativorans alearense]|uniref:hypothetical protein n=1 Tax=Chelativorans alearense TaxID=2681495 RepID=UPI0013D55F3E|nr:hypothetical protein [Chelativorans alearense]